MDIVRSLFSSLNDKAFILSKHDEVGNICNENGYGLVGNSQGYNPASGEPSRMVRWQRRLPQEVER
jgi:hypothetical protein